MKRYEVLADVPGTGKIRHMVMAKSPADAKARVQAAYPSRSVDFIQVKQRIDQEGIAVDA